MSEWPLVGRADELKLLRDLVTGNEPRHVVLAGPSGVGKTRLAHELLSAAAEAGMSTLQALATQAAAQVPFGAVTHLLHAALPHAGAIDDRTELLRGSVAALAEPSETRRLLLVDDAHLLDDGSATLVHQLAVTGAVAVVVTVAANEPAPDPVVALWKDGLARRFDLAGLDREATAELLASALGGPVDPATIVELNERSQGNVLYLREIVLSAQASGSLRDDSGLWRLDRPPEPSPRLVEIVEARLGQLTDAERALMELVAYGEPLEQHELASVADPALAETLERRELLASHLDNGHLQIHLAHPIYGEVIRARTPALRTRQVALALADAVERTSDDGPDDRLRVAAWRHLAGERDPDSLLEGAVIARWRYDFDLARTLARAAVDAGAGFDARLLAAHVASVQGHTEEAEAALAALAGATTGGDGAGAAGPSDDRDRVEVAVARFDNAYSATGGAAGSTVDAVAILDDARAGITDQNGRDRLAARQLLVTLTTEGPAAAADAAPSLLERADGEAFAFASLVQAWTLVRRGRLEAAATATEQGRAARQSVDSFLAWYPWWFTVVDGLALLQAGRFDEAEEIVASRHSDALAEGSSEAQAVFTVLDAHAVSERGRVRTAVQRGREAVAINQRLNRRVLLRRNHAGLALALALSNRVEEAVAELEELDRLDLPHLLWDELDVVQARAWTLAVAGDLPGAVALLTDGADLAARIGDHVGEVAALHGLARLGHPEAVHGRLAEVAGRVEGPLAAARAAHAAALVERNARLLETVADTFEGLGADLLAAEAAADAAVARRRAGEQKEATVAERRAGLLAEQAENPVTPALQEIEFRARLTPSEREAALLAIGGHSNKEIAAQLFLSSRTIENRLQRVYEKLGISGRSELADALSSGDT